jgi:hypothetical protein
VTLAAVSLTRLIVCVQQSIAAIRMFPKAHLCVRKRARKRRQTHATDAGCARVSLVCVYRCSFYCCFFFAHITCRYGQPPEEIIKDIAPGLELDEDGVPKIDAMGFFGDNEECVVM